jgi:hypothetical protein
MPKRLLPRRRIAHDLRDVRHDQEMTRRAKVEAAIGRYKREIGDTLRSRIDETEATEVAIAARVQIRMLEFGRPVYVRIA